MSKRILVLFFLVTFLSGFVILEDDFIYALRKRLGSLNQKYKRVKVDLFFNQPKFSPGDTVLFRTLYLTASDLKPVTGREILNIELFDDQGSRVLRKKVLVRNGFGANQIILPVTLKPALYLLVAYTDWMRNLDKSLFYQTEFEVVGTETLISKDELNRKIELYPEGGNFVSGIENNFVVKVTDQQSGESLVLKNSSGLELESVKIDKSGYGEFKILPEKNQNYYVELLTNGNSLKKELPQQQERGVAIHLFSDEPHAIKIGVQLSKNFDDHNEKLFLVLNNASGLVFSTRLKSNSGADSILLPKGISTGVYQAVVIDDSFKIWASRLIYVHTNSPNLTHIELSKQIYGVREKVEANVELVDEDGASVKGYFTVRVINKDMFNSGDESGFINNLLLSSDVSSSLDFKKMDVGNVKEVNRNLITQPCNWIDWNEVRSDKLKSVEFQPRRFLRLTGKALFSESLQPVPDSTELMFFFQKEALGYQTFILDHGKFDVPLIYDLWRDDEVFFAARYKGKDLKDISITTEKDSLYNFKARRFNKTGIDTYGVYAQQKALINRSFSFFEKSKLQGDSVMDPNAMIEDELSGVDYEIKIKDFVVFPTMSELVREVLRAVEHRKIKGKDVIRVYTTHKRPTNFAEPLYIIDGLFTKNTNTFLNLNPADILTIKVVKDWNKLKRFGAIADNGIIIVRTQYSNIQEKITPDHITEVNGLTSDSKPFFLNVRKPVNTPVLSSCLYWNPQVKLNESGDTRIEFFTSDDVGNFKMQIEGITDDGKLFNGEALFEVRFKPKQ